MAHRSHVRAIAERSAPQLGLITTDQMSQLGVSPQARRTLEAHGSVERLGASVWRMPGHPPSWRQQLLAATLEAGPDAVVSHVPACALWRFAGIAPGRVEVTVPAPSARGACPVWCTAAATWRPSTSAAAASCR